jgi:hypothetical protein
MTLESSIQFWHKSFRENENWPALQCVWMVTLSPKCPDLGLREGLRAFILSLTADPWNFE